MRGMTVYLYAHGNDLVQVNIIDYFNKHPKVIAMSRQV